jgi:hypothetical protein
MTKLWTVSWKLCKNMAYMNPQFTILIKQQNYGWSCTQSSGADRVFALKEQAIQFAQLQCAFTAAEVRICDRDGAEQRMLFGPGRQKSPVGQAPAAISETPERSIINFAAPGSF